MNQLLNIRIRTYLARLAPKTTFYFDNQIYPNAKLLYIVECAASYMPELLVFIKYKTRMLTVWYRFGHK